MAMEIYRWIMVATDKQRNKEGISTVQSQSFDGKTEPSKKFQIPAEYRLIASRKIEDGRESRLFLAHAKTNSKFE